MWRVRHSGTKQPETCNFRRRATAMISYLCEPWKWKERRIQSKCNVGQLESAGDHRHLLIIWLFSPQGRLHTIRNRNDS